MNITRKPVGYIIWNDEANAPRAKTGIVDGANFTLHEDLAIEAAKRLGKGFSVKALFVELNPPDVETPKGRIAARGCRDRWNQAVRAMENPKGADLKTAMTHILQILDDVIVAAEETQ